MENEASEIPSASHDAPQEEEVQVVPVKTERRRPERAYAPTPKQLEALTKARKAKQAKRKKVSFDLPREKEPRVEDVEEPVDQEFVRHVAEEPRSPVEVVRDNKLLQEFAKSAQVPIAPTGLGRKRKTRQEVFESDEPESEGPSTTLVVGGVVGVGLATLGAAYYLRKSLQSQGPLGGGKAEQGEQASATGPWWSSPAAPAQGQASESSGTGFGRPPWER